MKIKKGAYKTNYMLMDLGSRIDAEKILFDFDMDNVHTEELNNHMIRSIITNMTENKNGVVICHAEKIDLMAVADALAKGKSVVLLNGRQ